MVCGFRQGRQAERCGVGGAKTARNAVKTAMQYQRWAFEGRVSDKSAAQGRLVPSRRSGAIGNDLCSIVGHEIYLSRRWRPRADFYWREAGDRDLSKKTAFAGWTDPEVDSGKKLVEVPPIGEGGIFTFRLIGLRVG